MSPEPRRFWSTACSTGGRIAFCWTPGRPGPASRFETTIAAAVWDTGAGITVVDAAFVDAHRSSFREAGRSLGTDSTGSQAETTIHVMTGIEIGGCKFPPHRAAAVDLSRVNSTIEIPMDLILGYNTLRMANWLFDFPARRWGITRWLGERP